VQFLSFPISTIEKCFGRIFQARKPPKQAPRWQSWKPGPDYLVLHPKQTLTNWGALLIVSRHYSWKMFWSNFDDFPGPKNHRCRPRASKVVNQVQMTLFCTQNIPTLFGLQFLSFLVSTTENLFSQILATFPALDTTEVGPERVKCKTGPGWFCFELTVWVQFLSFLVNMTKKCCGRILTTFSDSDTSGAGPEQAKFKSGPGWHGFAPGT